MSTLVSDFADLLAEDAITNIPVYDNSAVVRVAAANENGRTWSYEESQFLLELWEENGRKGGRAPWTAIQMMWQERVKSQGFPERNNAQLKCRLRRITESGKAQSTKQTICHTCWQPRRGHVCTGIKLNTQQIQHCPSISEDVDSMYQAFFDPFDMLPSPDSCEFEFDDDFINEWLRVHILEIDVPDILGIDAQCVNSAQQNMNRDGN